VSAAKKVKAQRAQLDDSAIYKVVPKTVTQNAYMQSIRTNHITFAMGSAGSGKTFVATAMAAAALDENKIEKIVICRPIVEAGGEKLGFLPGDLQEKCDPYLMPMYDVFNMCWKHKRGNMLNWNISQGKIEIAPLAYMRGRSFKDCWILCDEAQNMTAEAMRMLITRFGEGCKMIITGDQTQRDRRDAKGFEEARRRLEGKVPGVGFINFHAEDVQRHEVVRDILDVWPE
jgi:phosphate starvation-inducible PhoH-like protein